MTGAGLRSLTYFGTLALSLLAAGEWLARRVHPLPDAPPAIGTPLEYADTNYTAIDDDAALWRTAATADADTDALGLRAPHGEDPLGDAVRVLVLGDANAFGADVDGSRTYCARAQEFFDRAFGRGTIAIKNGAVIGHTVVQGAAWFESRFADWRPDLVVIAYGNGVELEPARADRSDAEWIDAAHELRTRSPLRAIDVLRDAFAGAPATSYAPARVRASATQFSDALATLVGNVRTRGAKPLLLAPTVPTGRVGQESRDASLTLYRECVRRVAAASGAAYIDAARGLGADPFAFCVNRPRLSERGHAIVARALIDACLQDDGVRERVASRAQAADARVRAAARLAAFDVARVLVRNGPIAAPPAELAEPLHTLGVDDTGLPAFELLRAVVESPLAATNDARFAALERLEAPLPLRELGLIRAAYRGDRTHVDALRATPRSSSAIGELADGMAQLGSDPIEAVRTLQRAIDAGPGQPLPLFFAARAARSAGDEQRARALVHAGFECLVQDSAEPRGLQLLQDDSDAAVAAFLDREPVLFAATQPEALLRLVHWNWVCEPLARSDGHAMLRWGFRLGAAGFAADEQRATQNALAWAAGNAEREAALALDAAKRGAAAIAAAALDRSLAMRDGAEARYLRALVQPDQAPQDALLHLDRALELSPADGRFHLARGRVLLKLGQREAAIAAFTRALEIWPDSAETRTLLETTKAE